MPTAAIVFSCATFLSTFLGGIFALRFRHRLHLIMSFTAGVLLGVVCFDILPEIIELVHGTGMPPLRPMIALVTGFMAFHILEKVILIHHGHEDDYAHHHHPPGGGLLGAGADRAQLHGRHGHRPGLPGQHDGGLARLHRGHQPRLHGTA